MPIKYIMTDTMKARIARNLKKAMMWPSSNMMKQFIRNGLITHTNISEGELDDIKIKVDKRIKLYIDIMYVCGSMFLHTKSKNLNYITIQYLHDKKVSTIMKKLKYVLKKS